MFDQFRFFGAACAALESSQLRYIQSGILPSGKIPLNYLPQYSCGKFPLMPAFFALEKIACASIC